MKKLFISIALLSFIGAFSFSSIRGRFRDNQLVVSGEISPDATGIYRLKGQYNGKAYYQRNDESYYIYWNGANAWLLMPLLGGSAEGWINETTDIEAEYYHTPGTTGTATVKAKGIRRLRF